MKMKFSSVLITVGLLATTLLGTVVTSYASETKTAKLNNVSISVSRAAPTKVLAYNVDGYNYLRIADICRLLNYHVEATNTAGIPKAPDFSVIPYPRSEYSKGMVTIPLATAPNTASITFEIKTLDFGSYYSDVTCFNVGGYNYMKLADFVAASDVMTAANIAEVEKGFKEGINTTLHMASSPALSLDYDATAKVIQLDYLLIDLSAIYENLSNAARSESAAMPAPADTAKSESTSIATDDYRQKLINLTNDTRQKVGASMLSTDADLAKIAQKRAEAMAEQKNMPFDHEIQGLGYAEDMARNAGLAFEHMGENLLAGLSDSEDIINAWLGSPTHALNIYGNWNAIGVGCAKDSAGTYYWSQIFAQK